MSFSFDVRAASVGEVAMAVQIKMESITSIDPQHQFDSEAYQAALLSYLGNLTIPPGKGLIVQCSGSLTTRDGVPSSCGGNFYVVFSDLAPVTAAAALAA